MACRSGQKRALNSYKGIVEVNGSIPFGSTNKIKGLAGIGRPLRFGGDISGTRAATFRRRSRGFRTFRYPDSAVDGVAGTSAASASEGVSALSATHWAVRCQLESHAAGFRGLRGFRGNSGG